MKKETDKGLEVSIKQSKTKTERSIVCNSYYALVDTVYFNTVGRKKRAETKSFLAIFRNYIHVFLY